MGEYRIAVIPGDGIGPEIVGQAILVLEAVGRRFGHTFHIQKLLAGGCAIDATGGCLPQETVDACLESDAVLTGNLTAATLSIDEGAAIEGSLKVSRGKQG